MTQEFTHLTQLEALRDALAREARKPTAQPPEGDLAARRDGRQADKAAAEHRAQEVQVPKTADEFRDAIGDVTPLNGKTRVEHKRIPHPPLAHKRREDDQLVLIAAVSDEFEIDTLLHADDELSFRRPGVGRRCAAQTSPRRMGDSG